jgi:hydrogenase nickel incorporation protein HypA/HybF
MHEGSLTENLFEHVLIHAREAGARRVNRVKVTIGALSDATPESIQFYWGSMAPGTIAEGAFLEFEQSPGTALCPNCGAQFEVEELLSACPECGNFPVQVTGGDGVYLTSLEVETGEEHQGKLHESG